MRRRRRILTLALLAAAFASAIVLAQGQPAVSVPSAIGYEGVLELNGQRYTGTREMELSLFKQATGGLPVWQESQSVSVSDGRFHVLLGADGDNPIPDGALSGPALYLGLTVQGNQLSGRQQVYSVPFALRAQQSVRTIYVNDDTGEAISVGGVCGLSSTTYMGNLGGYGGAKGICESTCGSDTAHVCAFDEVARFLATGGELPQAGYMRTASAGAGNNCLGFTSTDSGYSSGYWYRSPTDAQAGPYPGTLSCSGQYPLLCCD